MSGKRRLMALFLTVCMMGTVLPAPALAVEERESPAEETAELLELTETASGYCGGEGDGTNLSWTLTTDGTLTISGTGRMANFGWSGGWGSYADSISRVIVQDGVTYIGKYAFNECAFSAIELPASLTSVGNFSFYNCSNLKHVEVPASTVGDGAFSSCKSLEKVVLSGEIESISSSMFSYCSALCEIELPSSVKKIEDSAFFSCTGLQRLQLPNALWYIGNNAFSYTGIKEAHLSAAVTSIGKSVWGGSDALTKFVVAEDNPVYCSDEYGVLYDKGKTTLISFPAGNGFDEYVIPDGVERIEGNAFAANKTLAAVTIPASVNDIGGWAFANCPNLVKAEFLGGVPENFGDDAFYRVASGFTIYYIFGQLRWTTPTWKAPDGTVLNTSTTLPEGILAGGTCGDDLRWALDSTGTTITISGTGPMWDYAEYSPFGSYKNVTKVIVEEGATSIGDRAFIYCKSVVDIQLPDTVTSIGVGAFTYTAIRTIDLPDRLTWIDMYAFGNCEELREIEIPDGVTTLNHRLFLYCYELRKVIIPGSVTTIDELANRELFYGCSKLKTAGPIGSGCNVEFGWTTHIPEDGLFPLDYLEHIIIPEGVVSIGRNACATKTYLKSITLPSTLTEIGDSAFYNSDGLQTIRIPDGVERIGAYAFGSCRLSTVFIGSGVKTLGADAFDTDDFDSSHLMTTIIFSGDAPVLEGDLRDPDYVTIYYPENASGWSTPTWNGYRTYPICEAADAQEIDFTEYYGKISSFSFTFKDITTGNYLENVAVEWKGNTFHSGEQHTLVIKLMDAAPDDVVVFRRAGYRTEERAIKELKNLQKILFYPTDYVSTPVLKRCIASKDFGKTFTSLVSDYAYFTLTAGDSVETLEMETFVNWFEHESGKMYLSQTLEPTDGVEIKDTEPIKVSHLLTAYKPVYLLLVTPDGMVYPNELPIYVVEPKTEEDTGKNVKLDLGEDITIPEQEDGFLKQFQFGMQMLDSAKLTLSVEDDGTVYGLVGVEIENEDSIRGIVESFEDEVAMSNIGDYADSVDSLKEFIKSKEKSGIFALEPPKSRTFVIEAEAQAVGYIKGKWNGDKMVFTECKVGLFVAGKMEWVWQFTAPNGAPFFFTFSLAPEMELTTNLLSNHDGSLLFLADPLEFTGEVAAKGSAGLGVEGTVGIAAYTKGGFIAEGEIPVNDNNAKVYVNLTVGVEAELFCWEADLEIWKSKDLYIHGSQDTANLQLFELETGKLEWKEQSRDYLYQVDLLAVDGSNTETTGEVVFNNVYTYANVQLAELENGTRLLVWTADPGTREVANNRTVLYYSYYDGRRWTQPMPVETEDDGTADFNPVIKTLDGMPFLFWQDASRPLTSEDTVSTTYGLMDISCAVFDTYNRSFASMGTVGTEYYDGAVDAILATDIPVIAWTSNKNENPLAADAADAALCFAAWNGTIWKQTTFAEGLGTIDQIAIDLDKAGIWFSADTDYDGATIEDKEIFFIDLDLQMKQVTDNDVADTKPESVNGTTVWYSDGEVVCGEERITLAESTDRYQYLSNNNGLEALVYVVTDSETRLSSLYASFDDGTGWGEPIRLDGGNGNIGSFSAQFASNGTLVIAVRERIVAEPAAEDDIPELSVGSQLKVYTVTPICDLVLENAEYLAHTMVAGGTLNVQVDLKNEGMAAIELVQVTVKDGDEVLMECAYPTALFSGTQETLCVPVTMPETLPDSLTVEVNVAGYEDGNAEDNSAVLPLRLMDLSLEGTEAYSDGVQTEVLAFVVNRGQAEVSDVTVLLKEQNGNVLSTQGGLVVDTEDGALVTFVLDQTFKDNTILNVEIIGPETENIRANNRADVLVKAETEGEVSISTSHLETDTGLNVIVEVSNTTDEAAEYLLFCAAYREDGKMLGVQELSNKEIAAGAIDYQQATFTTNISEIYEVRLFTLNEDFSPVAAYTDVLK